MKKISYIITVCLFLSLDGFASGSGEIRNGIDQAALALIERDVGGAKSILSKLPKELSKLSVEAPEWDEFAALCLGSESLLGEENPSKGEVRKWVRYLPEKYIEHHGLGSLFELLAKRLESGGPGNMGIRELDVFQNAFDADFFRRVKAISYAMYRILDRVGRKDILRKMVLEGIEGKSIFLQGLLPGKNTDYLAQDQLDYFSALVQLNEIDVLSELVFAHKGALLRRELENDGLLSDDRARFSEFETAGFNKSALAATESEELYSRFTGETKSVKRMDQALLFQRYKGNYLEAKQVINDFHSNASDNQMDYYLALIERDYGVGEYNRALFFSHAQPKSFDNRSLASLDSDFRGFLSKRNESEYGEGPIEDIDVEPNALAAEFYYYSKAGMVKYRTYKRIGNELAMAQDKINFRAALSTPKPEWAEEELDAVSEAHIEANMGFANEGIAQLAQIQSMFSNGSVNEGGLNQANRKGGSSQQNQDARTHVENTMKNFAQALEKMDIGNDSRDPDAEAEAEKDIEALANKHAAFLREQMAGLMPKSSEKQATKQRGGPAGGSLFEQMQAEAERQMRSELQSGAASDHYPEDIENTALSLLLAINKAGGLGMAAKFMMGGQPPLMAKALSLKKRLYAEYPNFKYVNETSPKKLTLKEVSNALKDEECLVEFFRYEESQTAFGHNVGERYGAIVVGGSESVQFIRLPDDADTIDVAVANLTREFRKKEEDQNDDLLVERLAEAQRVVWTPIRRKIDSSKRRFFVSLSGKLNYLSFPTLLDEDGRFLAENYEFHMVGSANDVVDRNAPKKNGDAKSIAIFAGPTYFSDDEGLAYSKNRRVLRNVICDLPGTLDEADYLGGLTLSKRWSAPQVLTGDQAGEEQFRALANPDILHIATHGFLLNQLDKDSAANRSNDCDRGLSHLQEEHLAGDSADPFFKVDLNIATLASGLALANVGETMVRWSSGSEEPIPDFNADGWLSVYDIGNLTLKGTDLVFLSACDTGLSRKVVEGEGALSIARAFKRAGAKNVIYTLWTAKDHAALSFSKSFYNKVLIKGEDVSAAYYKTQRSALLGEAADYGIASAARLYGCFAHSYRN